MEAANESGKLDWSRVEAAYNKKKAEEAPPSKEEVDKFCQEIAKRRQEQRRKMMDLISKEVEEKEREIAAALPPLTDEDLATVYDLMGHESKNLSERLVRLILKYGPGIRATSKESPATSKESPATSKDG